MERRLILLIFLLSPFSFLISGASAQEASWSMAGANPQRTSWVAEEVRGQLYPQWYRPIEPYIPSKVQIIAAHGLLYISTASGLYALNATNGDVAWTYSTSMPLGNSPTVVGDTLYVGGYDHRLHVLNALTGQFLWSYEAIGGQGFETNPLVANDMVYIGNRDGYLYAVHADTSTQKGQLAWKYQTGGPISFSAALSRNNLTIFVASNDSSAYALNAATGSLVWKSAKLPGSGFYSWWPVVYTDPNTTKEWVIFSGSLNYRTNRGPGPTAEGQGAHTFELWEIYPTTLADSTPPGPMGSAAGPWVPGTPTIDMSQPNITPNGTTKAVTEYFEEKPYRRTYLVLDAQSGTEYTSDFDHDGKPEYAPVLWFGTHSGNRYPPIVGYDGVVYQTNSLGSNRYIARGEVSGWQLGTPYVSVPYYTWNAVDEPQAYSAGGKIIYHNLCCDRQAGAVDISTPDWNYLGQPSGPDRYWLYFNYNLPNLIPGYNPYYLTADDEKRINDTYGGNNGAYGHHGNQNPPIPYKGKVYLHRSNTVIAFSPDAAQPTALPKAGTVSAPQPAITLPSKNELAQKLEDQISTLISVPDLQPGYYSDGIPGAVLSGGCGDNLSDYFNSPADTLLFLLRALPHLSAAKQTEAKNFIQQFFNKHIQTEFHNHLGWAAGASRSDFIYPDDVQADLVYYPASPYGNNSFLSFNGGWAYNPFQFYAYWLYAREFGNASGLYNLTKSRLESPVSDAKLVENPHWLNAYLAGYYGFLELEKLAGVPQSTTIKNNFDRLLQLRLDNLSPYIPPVFYGPTGDHYCRSLAASRHFIYLVPEIADYLNQNRRNQVLSILDYFYSVTPYWFVSKFDATVGEGIMQNLYDPHALFQAKAQILNEPYEELVKYLDVPAFARGDLFYIDNLVAALEAPYAAASPTPPPRKSGDANDDGFVDGIDYVIWLNHYSQSVSGPANGDFDNSGTVDGVDYVIWLNHYGL